MKIAAHRGASSLASENTLAAFIKAAELGCEWIEIDVQLTLDNIPAVIHDKTVNRCSDGRAVVSKMSLQRLKSRDAGLWFEEAFRGEQIPALEETLLLTRNYNLKTNIEFKIYQHNKIALLCERIKEVIVELQIDAPQLLFSSFKVNALKYIQICLPQIRRGMLWKKIPSDALYLLKELDAYSVHCDYYRLNKSLAKLLTESGYQLYCYTANSPELVKQQWDWGVEMVFTDMPQAFTDILRAES
jgi:glycerophosphoryl diester phosphodiesterase